MVGRVACQANPNTLLDVTTSVLFCYGDILNDVEVLPVFGPGQRLGFAILRCSPFLVQVKG